MIVSKVCGSAYHELLKSRQEDVSTRKDTKVLRYNNHRNRDEGRLKWRPTVNNMEW